MKISDLAIFTALLTIAYSKGSEAKEPSQLNAKKSKGGLLIPEHALVSFVKAPVGIFFGGGALLSEKCVIAPFIIFKWFYPSPTISDFRNFAIINFRVAIGLNPFMSDRPNRQHEIIDIKHNVGLDCDREKAIALVIIDPKSLGDATLPPSWVKHIPIAGRSYTPGLHSVSEFVVSWDEELLFRTEPISHVNVDNEGIISTQISVAYRGEHLQHLLKYLGGFITLGGMLTGLLYKHQPIESIGQTIECFFLPVDGNNTLIKHLKDKDIKIIDIDPAGRFRNILSFFRLQ